MRSSLILTILLPFLTIPLIAEEGSTLRLGVYEKAITAADPGDITIVLDSLLSQLELGNEYKELTRYSSRTAFITALKSGEVDLAPLETYQFIEFNQEEPLVPVAAPVATGEDPRTRFVLLTHADHEQSSLTSLEEKTIIIDQRWQSPVPTNWLDYHLSTLGASSANFKKVRNVNKASKAILPVFFKQHHFCVTTAHSFEVMAELNPQIKDKLKIVAQSPPYHTFLLCVRGSLDDEMTELIANDLTRMHNTEAGRQILLLSRAERFKRVQEADLTNIHQLLKFTEQVNSRKVPALTTNQDTDL